MSTNNDAAAGFGGQPLDPTVLALLDTIPESATANELKTRIGMIRLQQARIHGGATYAANVLESALAESQRSRHVHERLGEQLGLLERRVRIVEYEEDLTANRRQGEEKTNNGNEEDTGAVDNNLQDEEHSAGETDMVESPEKDALRSKLKDFERIVEESILREVECIHEDRKQLKVQETRILERLEALQKSVASAPASLAKSETIQSALASTNEYTASNFATAECVVCREKQAVRAIIPCGHLCLCDSCTEALLGSKSVVDALPYCPLCRGTLLSTLKIYTTK